MNAYDQGFHLLAFTSLQAAGAAFADVPGIQDGYATLQNSHYILQQNMEVTHAYSQGATQTEARINTPDLRAVSLPSITPIQAAAAPGDLPGLCVYNEWKPPIKAIDEVAVETSNGAGAPERQIVGLWVRPPGGRMPQMGPVFTVRATASIVLGNLVWGAGSFTFQQTLPAGRYQVIGMDVIGANLIFARLRFPMQGPLPGIVCRQAVGDIPWQHWRLGRAGLFGEFESTAPPTIELFGTAAPVTQTIYLDLVKVR